MVEPQRVESESAEQENCFSLINLLHNLLLAWSFALSFMTAIACFVKGQAYGTVGSMGGVVALLQFLKQKYIGTALPLPSKAYTNPSGTQTGSKQGLSSMAKTETWDCSNGDVH